MVPTWHSGSNYIQYLYLFCKKLVRRGKSDGSDPPRWESYRGWSRSLTINSKKWYIPKMSESTLVTQSLDLAGIPYRVFQHNQPPNSLEQAAAERGQEPGQVIRSILFRITEEQFVLVLVAGPEQLTWQKLRSYLGVSRLALASEEEVLRVTGAPIGGVGPLGLPHPIRILADRSIFLPDEISIGSGVRGIAVILKSADLRQMLGEVEIAAFK